MKKNLLQAVIIFFDLSILIAGINFNVTKAVSHGSSGTPVGGIIWENTTWTLENSPYIITDTVQIPENVTLTIEPGVTVKRPTSGDIFLLHGTVYAHGTINNKITETRRITVPAGTYDVFKLEFTSSEVTMTYKPPPELNMTTPIEMSMTMKGYEYFEKGTCLTVEAKFEQTASISMMGQTISMSTTLNMRLTEHTK